ncbi:hypothetical protein QTP88_000213 [Uroleucon formosanum]
MARSAELKKLIKKRNSIKSSIETINNYIETFNPSTQSIRQVSTRLTKLNELMEKLSSVQDDIIDLGEEYEQEQDDENERLHAENNYYTLKSVMEELVAKQTDDNLTNVASTSHLSVGDSVRLPTIQPPVFNGKLEDWSSFIDTFNALFHNNTALNDVQRLHYLKTSVSGTASDIIKNFSITSENYKVAYDELVRQYENKGLTIQSHIRALLQSPKVNTASTVELRNLHHHVSSHVRALKALGQPVQFWDAWLVTLICGQLDATTAGEWQLRQDTKELPTYASIELFLSKRVSAYEAGMISNCSTDKPSKSKLSNQNNKSFFTRSSDVKVTKCPLCSAPHKLYSCDKFNKLTIHDRRQTVAKLSLCYNCLNAGHRVESCYFPNCPKCGLRHNSKLHEDKGVSQIPKPAVPQDENNDNIVTFSQEVQSHSEETVLLATAIIHIYNNNGQRYKCRAVLDSGSQLNFIDQNFAKKLGLNFYQNDFSITGVGSMTSSAKYFSKTIISSRLGSHSFNVTLHSLPVIVPALPAKLINQSILNIPDHILGKLADPQFGVPGPIDILLGADIFFGTLGSGKWPLSKHSALYQTDFGWIIAGKLPILSHNNTSFTTVSSSSALSLCTSIANSKRIEENMAEDIFNSTYTQNASGRFIVKLPFKQDPSCLGDSRSMARRRFLNLEKKLIKDATLARSYKAFMDEYRDLGHMELADLDYQGPTYYLPHHAVFKLDSATTKVRVVFDGSAVASSGLSLNDILLRGPKVQPDLIQILWRFRIHNIVITADVAKMYRQVLVSSEDCNLQRIFFRASPDEASQEYKLNTVTYGTKSASYLATRCLHQVFLDSHDNSVKRILAQDFYVDDLLSCGRSEDECFEIHQRLQLILNQVGFPLRKWCSSSRSLINRIPHANADPNFMVKLNEEDMISTLGLLWQPTTDTFHFAVKDWSAPTCMTKRSLLSDINSVYDPIGLITPVLIKGKIFLQQLWTFKLDWDDAIPKDLQVRWTKFYSSLQSLTQLKIPRRVILEDYVKLELHGFCDASQEAFGGCVYLRSTTTADIVGVKLLTSKSRVAPMQHSTIPRLELCGALLVAELMSEVKTELKSLNIIIASYDVYLWTDSTIVISWIRSQSLFQVYVANRLARILDLTTSNQWFHVPTNHNPADLITRGVDAGSISSSQRWWTGPTWLSNERTVWPSVPTLPSEIPELRPVKLILTTVQPSSVWISNTYSNWMKLLRITVLVWRFTVNCSPVSRQREQKIVGPIRSEELHWAKQFWLLKTQAEAFPEEMAALKVGRLIPRHSCLKQLNPFIDTFGLLRVGGRLANAPIADSKKISNCTSFQRSIAKQTVSRCIQCFRSRPKFIPPFMAPLPRERVTIVRPFSNVGVDYCGPFTIRSGLRKVSSTKGYVCVFVCLVTRAVHLELVSSLTTADFLATLSRFMSRRGQVLNIYSDNGTNFVGADRELQRKLQEFNKDNKIHDFLAVKGITWHFIPPSSPHFGGLWESAVKAAKKHLYCISKGVTMTYDETTTLLCQIEAVLNSRPITPLSSSPSDFTALTPGHFLVGGPLMLPPEPDISNVRLNRLRRFQLMQSQMQGFWKRWSSEYLPQVQKRGKWTKPTRNVEVGDLAILKDDTLPPLHWHLVRIIKTNPGQDGIVRAATVRNSAGLEFKRPVVKLAILPTTQDEPHIDIIASNL